MSRDLDRNDRFSVATASAPEAFVVSVSGQADLHRAPELREAITDAIDAGQHRIVVDLSETTFVDSMTLGVLLGARRRVAEHGGRVVVVCPNPHLRRVFEITSLDRVFALSTSRTEAFAQAAEPAEPAERR